jgi:hypothetical protein
MRRTIGLRDAANVRKQASLPPLAQNGPSKFCGEGLMLRAERTWRARYLRGDPRYATDFLPRMDGAGYPPGAGAPLVPLWRPWPRLCKELRTPELAGVLWPTWRRFDPSSSPSASKSVILQREMECRQFARHSRRLASVFARIPN